MLIALIAGVPAIVGALFAGVVMLRTRTPSGQPIGALTEQTNHMAHASAKLTQDIHKAVGNGTAPSQAEA